MKSRILEELGESEILLPAVIAGGLAANDQLKVRMSALQAAAQHAQDPTQPPIDLTVECTAAAVDPTVIQSAVAGARCSTDGQITAPGLADLLASILKDVSAMIRAVAAGARAEADAAADRLAVIRAEGVLEPSDEVTPARIARLTEIPQAGADSFHLLVMDLHKALNRLAAACGREIVAGVSTYGLLPEDRALLESFMHGLERTRPLKFDHPGLDTTAMRSGSRLIIQNDVGATDAHVVVVAVEPADVTVTYTDVHLARAEFFTGLLGRFPVRWSGLDRKKADGLGDGGIFYLVTGRLEAKDNAQRNAFLKAIGEALVFLIDWNKARKALRSFVSKADAIQILRWAAQNHVGHRAFLELGGVELIASAVRHTTPSRIGFGERLDDALGRQPAMDFLKTVLRVSTQALLEGRSVRLVRDHIEADLVRHLERVDSALLAFVVRQAGLARDMAAAIAHHINGLQLGLRVDADALTARSRRIEEKADKIAVEARNEVARFDAGATIEQIVNRAEDAIDELEQAAFIASLIPVNIDPALLTAIAELCAAVVAGAEAAASGIDAVTEVPAGRRADYEDALAAVGRLIDVEHTGDACERAVTALVLRGDLDLRAALSLLELARALERATDRMASFGHLLRAHLLADLSA